ncbi:hypothetical protein CY34DRAFT_808277 [Suillus luteus UH-Slu-Lm8-n1]|uniref:Uncharacterized protein n=1 Tax=Suillus luteus UH-Slu-Lm8-n1 TaxID=930992 RepID=A0A0D0ACL5_9AGAM|nr:hypothetical protein CY34DRAFT_808277 [Suillus luteus UH-Slu-Lm8-n1]
MISNSAGGALDKRAGFKAMHDMAIFVVICDIAAGIAIVEASQATPRVRLSSCQDRPRSPLHSNQYFVVVFWNQISVHLQYCTSHKSNPTVRNNLCPPPRL